MNANVFLLLRLAIGASMFGHGLVRLPKLLSFANWMTHTFQKSMLPAFMVKPIGLVLPCLEFGLGLLLLLGLFTETASTVGALIMTILIFGTCMIENWEALPAQLIHLVFFTILLQFLSSNTYSLDQFLRK